MEALTYHVTKLSEGYMAKCSLNPEISVYGNTKEDAIGKIDNAIKEFERLFPERVKKAKN